MFGYRGIQLSKMQFWHFDKQTFGYRGTTVHLFQCLTLQIMPSLIVDIKQLFWWENRKPNWVNSRKDLSETKYYRLLGLKIEQK